MATVMKILEKALVQKEVGLRVLRLACFHPPSTNLMQNEDSQYTEASRFIKIYSTQQKVESNDNE